MERQFDDDTFYAEIRRQILLLTSEDNEDSIERKRFNHASSVGKGGSTRLVYNTISTPSSIFFSWETHSTGSTPEWLVKLWKSGKGTGVFIPQVVTGRRYQRPGTINGRKQIYRQVANKY